MNAKEQRLLDPALIPASLWDEASKTLLLPPILARAYQTIIDRHSLWALAESRDPKNPPTGGPTQEKTDQYFAQAFDGSVARAQLALLDPKGNVPEASNTCIRSLVGNRLNLTDAPCGAGAAAFAFLANIAELRVRDVLPRQPLDVFVIGAEPSSRARAYAEEVLAEIRPLLEEQAIFVEAQFFTWDVTDVLSNTDLIRRMTLASMDYPKRLLVVANFNAFLEKEKKRKVAERQLEELFRHVSGEHSVAVWIEPDMNRAIGDGGLFQWLWGMVKDKWRRFAVWLRLAQERSDENAPVPTSSARFCLPLNPTETARVGLAVVPLDLVRSR
jgi:hypothetical protein